jgi:hypothetical protein
MKYRREPGRSWCGYQIFSEAFLQKVNFSYSIGFRIQGLCWQIVRLFFKRDKNMKQERLPSYMIAIEAAYSAAAFE